MNMVTNYNDMVFYTRPVSAEGWQSEKQDTNRAMSSSSVLVKLWQNQSSALTGTEQDGAHEREQGVCVCGGAVWSSVGRLVPNPIAGQDLYRVSKS